MQLHVVCLYDSKALAYNLPQFVQSIGGAVRSFADEINRAAPDNVLFNHPGDFVLFEMGTYDDSDGKITMLETPRIVAVGNDHRKED